MDLNATIGKHPFDYMLCCDGPHFCVRCRAISLYQARANKLNGWMVLAKTGEYKYDISVIKCEADCLNEINERKEALRQQNKACVWTNTRNAFTEAYFELAIPADIPAVVHTAEWIEQTIDNDPDFLVVDITNAPRNPRFLHIAEARYGIFSKPQTFRFFTRYLRLNERLGHYGPVLRQLIATGRR